MNLHSQIRTYSYRFSRKSTAPLVAAIPVFDSLTGAGVILKASPLFRKSSLSGFHQLSICANVSLSSSS